MQGWTGPLCYNAIAQWAGGVILCHPGGGLVQNNLPGIILLLLTIFLGPLLFRTTWL